MSSTEEQKKKKTKKKKREYNFPYDFVKVTGSIPTWIWMRPKILHVNKKVTKRIKGGVLIASNHISFLDPIIIHCVFWKRRLHCLATKDLYTSPTKERFFNLMHCIKIDKENFNIGSLHTVCDRLKEGKAVVIFPEGKVNRAENVESYKSGAILMAHIAHKPIIPVYIVRRQHWYNRQVAVIGEPIDVNAMCGKIPSMEEIDKASAYMREKEIELMEFYNNKNKKKKEKQ